MDGTTKDSGQLPWSAKRTHQFQKYKLYQITPALKKKMVSLFKY
jgi:hypothetical protein